MMPAHLRGKEVSRSYKWVSLTIFGLGSLANILMPCLQAFYDIKIDNVLAQPNQEWKVLYKEYKSKSLGFKYASAACELISSVFMIWAVLALYCAIGRKSNLREFVKQRMMVLLLGTYLAYVISVIANMVVYTIWNKEGGSTNLETRVFVTWTAAIVFIFFV